MGAYRPRVQRKAFFQAETVATHWFHDPQSISNQLTGVGVSHRSGAVSTQGFVPRLLELYIC